MKRNQIYALRPRREIARDRSDLNTRLYKLNIQELFADLCERPSGTIALRWGAHRWTQPQGYALCALGKWYELPHADLLEDAASTFLFVAESGAIFSNKWDAWPCRTAHPKYEKSKPLLKSWERDFLTKTADVEERIPKDHDPATGFVHFPQVGSFEEKQSWRKKLWSAAHFERPDYGLQAFRVKYDKGVFHLYTGPLMRNTYRALGYWGVDGDVCIPDHPEIKFLRRTPTSIRYTNRLDTYRRGKEGTTQSSSL